MNMIKNLFSKVIGAKNKMDLDKVGEESLIVIANEYISALGGAENIKKIYSCSTRLRIILKESIINEEKLYLNGAKRIIKLDDFNYQIVTGKKAIKLEESIKKYLR